MSTVKQDVNEILFSAGTRALGTMEKLVTGPLLRRVSQSEHIFDLNEMWEELLTFLERNAKDSPFLTAKSTIFPNSLLTKDEMYEKLFKDTENPVFDALTQECPAMINCTCALMIDSQLKDQLPGGKYYNLSQSVRDDLKNCPSTTIALKEVLLSLTKN